MKTKDIIRYDVFDKRKRWMGGYSTQLDETHTTSSYYMAKINAESCNGTIFSVDSEGNSEEVKEIK